MSTRSPRSILVLTYWPFDDALIRTYTLPYLRLMREALPPGSTIRLITLEKVRRSFSPVEVEQGIIHHPLPYERFGARGMLVMGMNLFRAWRLMKRYRVDGLHAWCTPAGAIGYLLSMLTGKPLVVDSYEPHAEAMVENGTWPAGGLAYRLLFALERAQSHRAQHLIAAATGMEDYARSRYGLTGRTLFVKPACVDLEAFSARNRKDPALLRELGSEGKLVALYAGKFGGIYLDQEVFDFLRVARDHWGERLHVLLLTGHSAEELEPRMKKAGLPRDMFTIRFVKHQDMPMHVGLADFALTPVKPVPTKRYCTPVKDGEYWAMGLPVVITPGISDDSKIIADTGQGVVLEGLHPEAYRKAVLRIDHLLSTTTPEERFSAIRALAEQHRSFDRARTIYQEIYGSAE
jgi:glycosyltransferase involved in cell wall biosynthesis